MTTTPIHLRDLLRTFNLLQPSDNASRLAIAEILGFDVKNDDAEPPSIRSLFKNKVNPPSTSEADNDSAISNHHPENASTQEEINTASKINYTKDKSQETQQIPVEKKETIYTLLPPLIPSKITFLSQDHFPMNIRVSSIQKPNSGGVSPEKKIIPLLDRNSCRAIVLAALATIAPEGDIDIDRLLESLSRNKTPDSLPRLNLTTLRRGVQLLLDVSDAMLPYRYDQIILQHEIRRIVGEENTQVLRFVRNPLNGVAIGTQLKRTKYKLPRRGTPILLLTDLGIGGHSNFIEISTVSEWIEFVENGKKNQSPIIAFLPYSKKRWQSKFESQIHMIYWDRTAKASEIRKKIGKGHIISE